MGFSNISMCVNAATYTAQRNAGTAILNMDCNAIDKIDYTSIISMNIWTTKGRMLGRSPHMFYITANLENDCVNMHITAHLDDSSKESLQRLPSAFRPKIEQVMTVSEISPTTYTIIGSDGTIMVIDDKTITKDVMLPEFNISLSYAV